MSISKITTLVVGVYFAIGIFFIGAANIISAGSKYSPGQQKEVTVPAIFQPIQFVLDKLS